MDVITKPSRTLVAVSLTAAIAVTAGCAPENISEEILPITAEQNSSRQASGDYNLESMNFLLAWNENTLDENYDTLREDIIVRTVEFDGALGDPIVISEGDGQLALSDPTLSYNEKTNQYLAAWEAQAETADDYYGIDTARFAILSATGEVLSRTSIDQGCDHQELSLAYNKKRNQWLAAWIHQGETLNGECRIDTPAADGVYAQYIDAAGQLVDEPVMIRQAFATDTVLSDEMGALQLVYNTKQKEYLAVWQHKYEERLSESPLTVNVFNGLEAQRINTDLSLESGVETVVNAGTVLTPESGRILETDPQEPALAYNPDDNVYAITYRIRDFGETNGQSDNWISKIQAKLYSTDDGFSDAITVAQVEENLEVGDTAVDEASVAYEPATKGFLLTWQQSPASDSPEGYDFDVVAARMSSTGVLDESFTLSNSENKNDMKADDIHKDIICSPYACLTLWQEAGPDIHEIETRHILAKFIQ